MFSEQGSFLHDGPYFTVEVDETYGYIIMFSISSVEMFLSGVLRIRISPVVCLTGKDNTVNSEIFARILFSRIALKGIFATLKIRDLGILYLYQ